MDLIKFAKVKEDSIIPSKIDENGGYDIYANFEEDYIIVKPLETVLIPNGIASSFSSEYVIILKERGSSGVKGMAQRAGVIDSGFRGEWKTPITNSSNKPLIISKLTLDELIDKYGTDDYQDDGEVKIFDKDDTIYLNKDNPTIYPYSKAICQALVLPVPRVGVVEISYEELINIPSERGLGMLGSSNK